MWSDNNSSGSSFKKKKEKKKKKKKKAEEEAGNDDVTSLVIHAADCCMTMLNQRLKAIVVGPESSNTEANSQDLDAKNRGGDRQGMGGHAGSKSALLSGEQPYLPVQISMAVQVALNASYLIQACSWLEAYIYAVTTTNDGGNHATTPTTTTTTTTKPNAGQQPFEPSSSGSSRRLIDPVNGIAVSAGAVEAKSAMPATAVAPAPLASAAGTTTNNTISTAAAANTAAAAAAAAAAEHETAVAAAATTSGGGGGGGGGSPLNAMSGSSPSAVERKMTSNKTAGQQQQQQQRAVPMMQGRLTGGRCFQARLLFRQTQSICEDTIFKLVNQKIQLLMALALDVDWAPSTPPISEPHDYVTDVITYLTTTFISLQKLPSSIRENVPVAGFTLITEYYMEIFSGISGSGSSSSGSGGSSGSRRACRFNMYGICNLSCDLKALEHFAKAQAVPNLHNAFRNIRQLQLDDEVLTRLSRPRMKHTHTDAYRSLMIVDMLLTGKILDLSSQIKLEMRTNFKNTEESDKIASIGEMKRLVMILGNYKTLKRKEANILPIELLCSTYVYCFMFEMLSTKQKFADVGVRNLSSRDVSNAMKRLKAKIRAMEKRGAS
eukprot:jgi/Bigna1/86810/estExt_fgenesh1_pg.C_140045